MLNHNSDLEFSVFILLFRRNPFGRRSNILLFAVYAAIIVFVINEPGRILARRNLFLQSLHAVSRGHRFLALSCFVYFVLFFFFCYCIYLHHQLSCYSYYRFLFASAFPIYSFKFIKQTSILSYCYPRQLYDDTS